jgi:hypothetical protein
LPRSEWSARLVVVCCLLLLAGSARSQTRSGVVKERAPLRAGPGAATGLLGEVAPGTTIEVLGESGGWRWVQTPEGRVGYVWSEHIVEGAEEAKPAEAPKRDAPPSGARTLLDEVRDLRGDVAALRARPDPASAADVERLRREV